MTFAIAYRNSATGKLSYFLESIQIHFDPQDKTNGSPTSSYTADTTFVDEDDANKILQTIACPQGWEVVSIPTISIDALNAHLELIKRFAP